MLFIQITFVDAKKIDSKWTIEKTDFNFLDDNQQEISFLINYKITNNDKTPVWFYDMERKNDFQYEEIKYEKNIIEKKTYIFKLYEKSNGGWYGSWGYSPVYPDAIKISSKETIKGKMKIKFVIDKKLDARKFIY